MEHLGLLAFLLLVALVVLGPLAGKRIGIAANLPEGQLALPEFPT